MREHRALQAIGTPVNWVDHWNRHWRERDDLVGVENLAAILVTIASDPETYAMNCPHEQEPWVHELTINVWVELDGQEVCEHFAIVTEGRDLSRVVGENTGAIERHVLRSMLNYGPPAPRSDSDPGLSKCRVGYFIH